MYDATDNTGWHEFVTADDSATTHIAYVYEDGSVYLPEGPDVVTETDFRMAAATERFWKLERAEESALPVRNAQIEAVLALHREEVRWTHESNPEVSWGSREQALEWDDEMDPEDITTFSLCSECKRVEEGPDGEHIFDVGYETSTWPCPTVRAIEEAGK